MANPNGYGNPFRYGEISLDAELTGPSGRTVRFWGFYDGDGRGGREGGIWKLRFMPDAEGTWSYRISFSDGTPVEGGDGSFEALPSEAAGPAGLDPRRPDLLVDARGRPIHWRGYAIKHRLYREPLDEASARTYVREVIERHLAGGGYNATYFAVPSGDNVGESGRPGEGTQSLWGDFRRYDLQAARFTDTLLDSLRRHGIWTAGWITFTTQREWESLWDNHREWIRYFVARYAPYSNYFLWSPCWEVHELRDWIHRTDVMMRYARSLDPWKRPQGAHDRARLEWKSWQSIHARQSPSRTVAEGNNRTAGVDSRMGPYGKVILGAEDLWEMAAGHYGQPRNGTEVRRGLWGQLLAGVLPLYDELDEFAPPEDGVGRGEGEPFVRIAYDWWYSRTGYRDPRWRMLNDLLPDTGDARCSGIPGREYVVFKERGGRVSVDLSGAAGRFDAHWLDPSSGRTWEGGPPIPGGGLRVLQAPFDGDAVLHLRLAAPGQES